MNEGQQIDQHNTENAKRFVQFLNDLLKDLDKYIESLNKAKNKTKDKDKDNANELEDLLKITIKTGGDPARRDKTIESYRINLPGGARIYLVNDKNNPQIILPREMPKSIYPEALNELRNIARTGETLNGITVDYKPPHATEYKPINLKPEVVPKLSEVAKNLPQSNNKGQDVQKVINKINDFCKEVQESWKKTEESIRKTFTRESDEASKERDLGKENKEHPFNKIVQGLQKQGASFKQFGASFTEFVREIPKQINETKNSAERFILERSAARELYTFAQKLDDPKQPGRIKGINYEVETLGPGKFQLKDTKGNVLINVHQPKFLGPSVIKTDPNLSSSELVSIISQLNHLNASLGDRGITQYMNDSHLDTICRDMGGFCPGEILLKREILKDNSITTIDTQATKEDTQAKENKEKEENEIEL
jgi:hypothetical protein